MTEKPQLFFSRWNGLENDLLLSALLNQDLIWASAFGRGRFEEATMRVLRYELVTIAPTIS